MGFWKLSYNILRFIRSAPDFVYNCHNPNGIKLATKIGEDKFKYNFQDSINPVKNNMIGQNRVFVNLGTGTLVLELELELGMILQTLLFRVP